jgi:nicotinamidase-related amidase
MTFDCCGQHTFLEELKEHNKNNVVLTGMETHICVLQTCIGLLKGGINVHVVRDAICSRTKENWMAGKEFMRDVGGLACTETVLFQLLRSRARRSSAVSRMINNHARMQKGTFSSVLTLTF